MQFIDRINSLLAVGREVGMAVLVYGIVPFAPNAGLITWVNGAETLQKLVDDFGAFQGLLPVVETSISWPESGSYSTDSLPSNASIFSRTWRAKESSTSMSKIHSRSQSREPSSLRDVPFIMARRAVNSFHGSLAEGFF
jgi:hypothetical protein